MSGDTEFDYAWSAGLSGPQRARVASALSRIAYRRGGIVARVGEPARFWYGVETGLVKVSGFTDIGKPLCFMGIHAGEWLGAGALLGNLPRQYDLVALRDSELVRMPRETFRWLLEDSPAFARWLLGQQNQRLGQFIQLLAINRESSQDVRVARTLLLLVEPRVQNGHAPARGPMRDILLTQDEIAQLACASRPRTNEVLHRLAAAQLVELGYAHVRVVDVDGLRRFQR